MAVVYEKKQVPENCSTCLYGPNALRYDGKPVGRIGCGNANMQNGWMRYAMLGVGCAHYWLDQNRFERR